MGNGDRHSYSEERLVVLLATTIFRRRQSFDNDGRRSFPVTDLVLYSISLAIALHEQVQTAAKALVRWAPPTSTSGTLQCFRAPFRGTVWRFVVNCS
ncbi:MAG: hypothetical protein GDA56_32745 [Hormoscilla sp. GM7CHS1pb]|nr:hypothetical protein [Hormoscilla sp. GM7CHS1pb]